MAETIALIDTDVAILLLVTKPATEAERARVGRARQAITDVKARGARCFLATPTLVEMASWPAPSEMVRTQLKQLLAGLRAVALDVDGAEAAGQILRDKLKKRPPGKARDEIKFDALIAGVAHARSARWLVTGNAKDYQPMFAAIDSNVTVVDIDAPPQPALRKQLTLDEQGLKKA